MEDLIQFFEKKINKQINILEYNMDTSPLNKLNNDQDIVIFNNKKYLIEITDSLTLSSFSGRYFLIYQDDLDFETLSNVLSNLYDDIKIVRYNNFLVLNTNSEVEIDANTLSILETETYKNTYIADLDVIYDINVFKFRVSVFEDILQLVNQGYRINKYVELQDLFMHNLTKSINKEKTFLNFIDNDKIDLVDDNLLHTGLIFIENDLNISKTSTSLFLHRNTLIYRLDKIKELLNLDLKNFKDAQIFYLSVKSYKLSKYKSL